MSAAYDWHLSVSWYFHFSALLLFLTFQLLCIDWGALSLNASDPKRNALVITSEINQPMNTLICASPISNYNKIYLL